MGSTIPWAHGTRPFELVMSLLKSSRGILLPFLLFCLDCELPDQKQFCLE